MIAFEMFYNDLDGVQAHLLVQGLPVLVALLRQGRKVAYKADVRREKVVDIEVRCVFNHHGRIDLSGFKRIYETDLVRVSLQTCMVIGCTFVRYLGDVNEALSVPGLTRDELREASGFETEGLIGLGGADCSRIPYCATLYISLWPYSEHVERYTGHPWKVRMPLAVWPKTSCKSTVMG